MGQMTSQVALQLRWAEPCADPRWNDLGGKLELNGRGVIEMSPANNRHGIRQGAILLALSKALPQGTPIVECSVLTADGIHAPDVGWASAAFMADYGEESSFRAAPELCVEVRSPSNTDVEMAHKTALYLEAGAIEAWIVEEDGARQVLDRDGPRSDILLAVAG